ncbi:thiosulfate reductase cytochrome b subunit [Rhodopseudomonas julia]|uniref:Thiosulfate reductase cytochrome b subunit n=1 Tax=Rhodopseudomonas julia TaxID=200617 RepID=A0ABU0C8V8_9BRAD|nr:cytochrome b/b6 domain-containing protein [Rhodopseudomonas julia]MDQ0326950.1 thiosulfate reductase cytochrome b subunit [Rhodopseudomonas julia]
MSDQAETQTEVVYRHRWATRIWHWLNAFCLFFLLASGLQIFNAHPALYLGAQSNFSAPLLSMTAERTGDGSLRGLTEIGSMDFDTTGFLGASREGSEALVARGFPAWATIPSYRDLATGRVVHFFFAWVLVASGLAYVCASLFNGHFRRDLIPEWGELRTAPRTIGDHLRFRFGREAHYNILQKLTYLIVILGLIPAMVATGLAMSPGMDAAMPWLLDLFGGRQSARTLHFVTMSLLVLFFVVHIAMVLAAGPVNEMRAIITGRYRVRRPASKETA